MTIAAAAQVLINNYWQGNNTNKPKDVKPVPKPGNGREITAPSTSERDSDPCGRTQAGCNLRSEEQRSIGSPEPAAPTVVNWKSVPATLGGFVNFGLLFAHAEHVSGYARMRIYSPENQQVVVLLGSDDQVRLWLNGELIYEDRPRRPAIPDADAVPATLKAVPRLACRARRAGPAMRWSD